MLIRFIAKNIYSFKEETEFNLFPSLSKARTLTHHKAKSGSFNFLRFSAVYGANGSGKSNLIKAISLLKILVEKGKLSQGLDNLKFKLNAENLKMPISLGIEFVANDKVYFYTITFDNDKILHEYLAESHKKEDILIFERTLDNEIQKVEFYEGYYKTDKDKLFVEVLSEKMIEKKELLITFLSKKYTEDFKSVRNAFDWFENDLLIMDIGTKLLGVAHVLDKDTEIKKFINTFIHSLNTGISEFEIERKNFEEFMNSKDVELKKQIIEDIKKSPLGYSIMTHTETGEEISVAYENGEVIVKCLISKHQNSLGENVNFTLAQESDGTKRLIDYLPAFQLIIDSKKVVIIDEIERSIHPKTIKEIIKKLSMDENLKGQLIFSTHESNLLDQSILRPDEIWFTQKDIDGSSKMYPLSDFKISNTANIENGYLEGRFGGIPFLSNLKDLNWKK